MKKSIFLLAASTLIALSTGCTGLNDSFYNSPYDSGYSSPYRESSWEYEQRRRNERDRWENDRERRRIEEERRRLQKERDNVWSAPASAKPERVERCPSGFSPSERKCSTEERRRGCKDMRLPGGLGCVKR